MASEPIKSTSLISGESLNLQVSEPVGNTAAGDTANVGGNVESGTHRVVRGRIIGLAIVFSGLLLLLGLAFVYLRLDHATRGFHSGRLQLWAAFFRIDDCGNLLFFLESDCAYASVIGADEFVR